MAAEGLLERNPLREALAAVSVGKVDGEILLDLDYEEDCRAQVDMNLVVTESGRFIEIQGTAETEPFTAEEMASLTAMARSGIAALIETQKRALEGRS